MCAKCKDVLRRKLLKPETSARSNSQ